MSPGFAGWRTGHQAVRGSSCAPAAAARSVPATCTSHLVPSPEENHDAREASPRSSPSTDPTHPRPRLGFSCPGEAGHTAQAVLRCRGSIPLRTCMELVRGAGISMGQGVPAHRRGEMSKGRSSATLIPAITPPSAARPDPTSPGGRAELSQVPRLVMTGRWEPGTPREGRDLPLVLAAVMRSLPSLHREQSQAEP